MNQDFNTFENPSIIGNDSIKENNNKHINEKLDAIDDNITKLCNGINKIEEAVNLILNEVQNKRVNMVNSLAEAIKEEPKSFEEIEPVTFEPIEPVTFEKPEITNPVKVETANEQVETKASIPAINNTVEAPIETLDLDGMISIDSLLKQSEEVPTVTTVNNEEKNNIGQTNNVEIIDINIPNAYGDGKQRSIALDLNSHNSLLDKKGAMALVFERAA